MAIKMTVTEDKKNLFYLKMNVWSRSLEIDFPRDLPISFKDIPGQLKSSLQSIPQEWKRWVARRSEKSDSTSNRAEKVVVTLDERKKSARA